MKMQKRVYLKKKMFPDLFPTFFNDQCTGGSEKQQINSLWPYYQE